jgi:hypothetical protein
MKQTASMKKGLFQMECEQGEICFAMLDDGRCAIVRDGAIVRTHASDDLGVGRALKEYFRMIEESGGAQHPFPVIEELSAHPYAG